MSIRRIAVITGILGCAAIVACASKGTNAAAVGTAAAPAAVSSSSCEITNDTLVLKPGGPVYRDCGVDERARIMSKTNIEFRPQGRANENCFRTSVEFVVDENGHVVPETMRFVRRTDAAFQEAVIRAIPNWKYLPARRAGAPVRQLVREDPMVSTARNTSGGRPSRGCS